MAAIFADENVAKGIVAALRSFGHDVLTAREAGRAGCVISDDDQLQYATIE